MGAGKGWSSEETVFACRAYQTASEDPRKGNGKKKDVFAAQVLEVYNSLIGLCRVDNGTPMYNDRTGEAIIQRCRKARCECIKFEGIVNSIKARDPTGSPTDEQIERAALAVYNGEANLSQMYSYFTDRTKDAGSAFVFYDSLKFFRTTHTWKMISVSKSKNVALHQPQAPTVSPSENEDTVVANDEASQSLAKVNFESPSPQLSHPPSQSPTPTRPSGTKRSIDNAKQMLALHKGAEAIEKMAEASRKRTKIAQEMLELDKQKSMVALFSMPGTDEGIRKEFMRLAQMRALSELQSKISPGTPTSMANSSPSSQSMAESLTISPVTTFAGSTPSAFADGADLAQQAAHSPQQSSDGDAHFPLTQT